MSSSPFRPTLTQVLAAALAGFALSLGVLFAVVFDASRKSIMESSERIRDGASARIGERIASFLSKAPHAARQFQEEMRLGLVDPKNLLATEHALFDLLLTDTDLSELTLTYGLSTGFDSEGKIQLAPEPRWQLSVVRAQDADGQAHYWSRYVHREGERFVADRRELKPTEDSAGPALQREDSGEIADPAIHRTFTTPARKEFFGRAVPSDPHYSQLDEDLPEAKRRIEVSVQRALVDGSNQFAGVLRVGLFAQRLDQAVQLKLSDGNSDPHRIFLCDQDGRLVTRLAPSDEFKDFNGDLRVDPSGLPEEIARALADPSLKSVADGKVKLSGEFQLHDEVFLTTFRAFPEGQTQDWIVGIVVPRSFYHGKLTAMRNRLLIISLGIIVLLVLAGGLILRGVHRGHRQIVRQSLRMNSFEFSPSVTDSSFRDVSDILEGLEKAKTAMRVMSKYAPLELVRRLYRDKHEPALGGELTEISIMFTDIKNFTTFSEQLPPDILASALGRYLETMTRVIQKETRGTIDKYIGDAIMALWNAPEAVSNHAHMACTAALRCREAGRALSASSEWKDLPVFETRFGLHRGTALVGHFGAPDRMNYTGIGDAINLASRLEGLNKHYGTLIIVSAAIQEQTRNQFAFRLLDCVSVKGKTEAIQIFELLGFREDCPPAEVHAVYEDAFAAYGTRDFAAAVHLLEGQKGDPPSAVLLARCRAFLEEPPPAEWRGVHVFENK